MQRREKGETNDVCKLRNAHDNEAGEKQEMQEITA